MAITYTVPTPSGVQTRKSAAHTLAGQRYHFLALHVWIEAGDLVTVTWHTRRDLADTAHCYYGRPGSTRRVVVPILPEHCREHGKRSY